jgi:hypothetical protein
MTLSLKSALVLILVQVYAHVSIGQVQDLVTDRPDQSNAPTLVPVGALQIETGFAIENATENTKKLINYYNDLLMRVGVNDNFEIRTGLKYMALTSPTEESVMQSGLTPIFVGAKIKLAKERRAWPEAAVITHVAFKTWSNAITPTYTSGDLALACLHTLTDQISLTYNFCLVWDGETPSPGKSYSLSIAYQATRQCGMFFESYGAFPEDNNSDHRVDAGFTFKIKELVQFDVAGGLQYTSNLPAHFFTAGLSYRLFK